MAGTKWQMQSEWLNNFQTLKHISNRTKKLPESWDSSVNIAMSYGQDDQGAGVWFPAGTTDFSLPYCPDQLWGPTSFPFNWYQG
jgi:hypothetical protein